MADIKLTINDIEVVVPQGTSILNAAYQAGVDIPRLCFLKNINETSACRICVVEIVYPNGRHLLKNSCCVAAEDGTQVYTNTPRVKRAVTMNLKLLAASHKFECWKCPREHNCEFLALLRRYNVENTIADDPCHTRKPQITNITSSITIDSSKCLLCGRCISTCEKLAGLGVLNYNYRGSKTYVGPALNHSMEDAGCIYCGKCIQACPTAALKETDEIGKVEAFLEDKDLYVVAQSAPAVRAGLGEEFGYPIGTNVEGKMNRALQALGFNDVADVNFAADLTIMEEGTELIGRIKNGGVLPMFTSCSPGWIRYIEQYYPEYIPNISSCKSPHQMQGAITKSYWAKKMGIDPAKIRVVSIMPCSCKKHEASLPEMEVNGLRDVDAVLTTRELARMIKLHNIDFKQLEDYQPDTPIAQYTGAAVIFGATGGVMEAALRTVYHVLTSKDLESLDITPVRGLEDIKEATININGMDVNVAVVHGGANIGKFLTYLKTCEKKYTFVEFMGCTGGCVNGGGQPIVNAKVADNIDVRAERAKALYTIDAEKKIRQSHENIYVQKLYEEFLGEPNSHLAHELLHTSYKKKTFYNL